MTKLPNHFTPDDTPQAWASLKTEVIFDPTSGNIKPWELRGVFSSPYRCLVYWGSFQTEAAANKKAKAVQAAARQYSGL